MEEKPKVQTYTHKGKTPEELAEERKENILAIVLVVIVMAALAWWLYSAFTTPPEQPRVAVPIGVSPSLGSPDAPVTVVVFSDFQCPYCAQFALGTMPQLEGLIATGQVRFVYKHFPLATHAQAPLAAQAAACAQDQGRFWEYHDLLYANQDGLEMDDLESYARDLDLDTGRFEECLESGARASAVAQDQALGRQLGVTGTPTFFFNGRRVVGALSPEQFRAELAREME